MAKLLERAPAFARTAPRPSHSRLRRPRRVPTQQRLANAEKLAEAHAPATPGRRALALGLLALFVVAAVRDATPSGAHRVRPGPHAHERVDDAHA